MKESKKRPAKRGVFFCVDKPISKFAQGGGIMKHMKKYMPVLFVFSLFITLLGFGTNSASAQFASSGCMVGDVFNRTTGQPCGYSVDCMPGDVFSSVTGIRCDSGGTPIPVYPPGCTSNQGFSTTTGASCGGNNGNSDNNNGDNGNHYGLCRVLSNPGLKIGSKGDSVKEIQQTLKDEGLLSGKVDGIYGSVTDGAIKDHYRKCPTPIPSPIPTCVSPNVLNTATNTCIIPPTNTNNPVISGVSGPQKLDVNQQGTWTVKASSNKVNLSYQVSWGDEGYQTATGLHALYPAQQSATFTHYYTQAGMYTPTFTVTSENTIRCITTPCPSNAGSAQTSLSVNVGNTSTQPTITLSPSAYISGTYGDSVSADALVPVFAINVTANSQIQLNGLSIMSDTTGVSSKMSGFYISNGFSSTANIIGLNSGPIFNTNGTTQYDFNFTDTIDAGTTKKYVVYAKTALNASGNFRFGIGGVSHDTTTSTAVGVGLWGQYKRIVSAVSTQPSITSISPNSASVGSSVAINGSNFNLHLPNRVMFSDSHYVNGIPGITYITGVTSLDGSKVTFIVPNISAIDGWISVVNVVNQESNSVPFTITTPSTQPSITVLNPNGGESMTKGQYSTIQWSSKNLPTNATMNIYVVNSLSSDNSPTGQIASGLNPNEGPFNKQLFVWKSTGIALNGGILPLGKYKIDLEVQYPVPITTDNQKGFVVIKDLSDSYFTITAPIATNSNLGASLISAFSSFPAGCTSTQGYSITTGKLCSSR